jgi:hypothetical protein
MVVARGNGSPLLLPIVDMEIPSFRGEAP